MYHIYIYIYIYIHIYIYMYTWPLNIHIYTRLHAAESIRLADTLQTPVLTPYTQRVSR